LTDLQKFQIGTFVDQTRLRRYKQLVTNLRTVSLSGASKLIIEFEVAVA
jgi:hypothetical protein